MSLAPPEHGVKIFPLQVKICLVAASEFYFSLEDQCSAGRGLILVIPQLLPMPRQSPLPLQGEDVAHVPIEHGPNHEDRGVVRHCRTPEEREEDNSTETIRVAAVPTGHPRAGFGLWRSMASGGGLSVRPWPMPTSLQRDAVTTGRAQNIWGDPESQISAFTKAHPTHPIQKPPNSSDSIRADKSAGGKGLSQPPRGLWSHPQLSGHQKAELSWG